MEDLPPVRVQMNPPFTITGVDYAGPFAVKDKPGRGSKIGKGYASIFICLSTKAVHIELVSSLSTQSFMSCLRRFISRRGKPSQIHSDNGTNFVGASKELGSFIVKNQKSLREAYASEDIEWHFLPSYSPHFGGLWEAAVRSTKHHLRSVINDTNLTFEELSTILAQIEAILNSRPLTLMSSDPNDLSPLTPAHFLIGKPLVAAPDKDLQTVNCGRLDRFQLQQQICQHFWTKWCLEYISELQTRTKWKTNKGNLNVGDMVLTKDNRTLPTEWQLGRVVEIHRGADGQGRVFSLQTRRGVIKRNFTQVCPLPNSD